ncbi:hypothetical protein [Pseudomonas sp. GL-RE-19]|uniref:hypothetical protein n=1 Tax=Pseudomonas sp. GL-RE-19 TaxID=2832389 RepID=UPI001CBFF085|nr:hypothetical protein [Pseudomonas sp. GL-RE-19]
MFFVYRSPKFQLLALSACLSITAGCSGSQDELEKTVHFHDALFPEIGDVKTLRVSDLSAIKTKSLDGICGTAFYDLADGRRQSPSRFLMYVSPIKAVVLEDDHLAGHNSAFAESWSKLCGA